VQRRRWAQAQVAQGNLPASAAQGLVPSTPAAFKLIVAACSTLSLLVFGYRMYERHYAPGAQQHTGVRLVTSTMPAAPGIVLESDTPVA
jgi:hypothetical protein